MTIQRPIEEVFRILGTDEGLGPSVLLSSLASDFKLLKRDTVPTQGKLEDAHLRTTPGGPGLPRQGFSITETMKVVPGVSFLDVHINVEGTITWDQANNITLYESITSCV